MVGISVQVPALFHCHLPCVEEEALAVMTTPARVLADEPAETLSLLSEKLAEKREETVLPVGAAVSSKTAVSVADPEATGASLTAVMDVERETLEAEKLEVPPLVEALMEEPLARPDAEESTRRVVSEPGVPFQSAAGRKRMEVAALR